MTTPADGGSRDQREAFRAELARRRARERGWGPPDGHGPPWARGERRGPRRGLGCLFFLIFLFVAAVLFAIAFSIVQAAGPFVGLLAVVVVLLLLIGLGRIMRRNLRLLDDLLEATRRVEGGDYSVRIGSLDRGLPAVRALVRGFDTMVARLDADELRQLETLCRKLARRAADQSPSENGGHD